LPHFPFLTSFWFLCPKRGHGKQKHLLFLSWCFSLSFQRLEGVWGSEDHAFDKRTSSGGLLFVHLFSVLNDASGDVLSGYLNAAVPIEGVKGSFRGGLKRVRNTPRGGPFGGSFFRLFGGRKRSQTPGITREEWGRGVGGPGTTFWGI